jgi:preprotein translocase subunit YajC
MVSALKRGDDVVTSGGIVAKVEKVYDDDKIDLLISENVIIKVIKSTVQSLLSNPNIKK